MAIIPISEQFIGASSNVSTSEKRSALVNSNSQAYTMQDFIDTIGGGLGGTQYVFVAADGTDLENAVELQAAYVTAQGMSPSITNRITIIAAPGNYNFSTVNFVMNTDYIDLVSLDGNRSIVFNGSYTIVISANDIFVKGVNVGALKFDVQSSSYLVIVENCKGGDNSFGSALSIINGRFTNCFGGYDSFSAFGTASGVYKDCTGYDNSFAIGGTASGTFTNCIGGDSSFAGGGTASGEFNNCKGGINAFGALGIASGTFTNCIGRDYSFGGDTSGTLNGILYYCRIASGTFQTVSGGGRTVLCIDGNNNQNNQ